MYETCISFFLFRPSWKKWANREISSSGEEALLEYIEKVKSIKETGQKAEAVRSDYSQRWFTLMQSTRPFILKEFREIADHVRETDVFAFPVNQYS